MYFSAEPVTDLAIARKGEERDGTKLTRRGGMRYSEQGGSGIQPGRRDAAVKSLAQSASFWRDGDGDTYERFEI